MPVTAFFFLTFCLTADDGTSTAVCLSLLSGLYMCFSSLHAACPCLSSFCMSCSWSFLLPLSLSLSLFPSSLVRSPPSLNPLLVYCTLAALTPETGKEDPHLEVLVLRNNSIGSEGATAISQVDPHEDSVLMSTLCFCARACACVYVCVV